MGRIKRKASQEAPRPPVIQCPECPLCGRPIPTTERDAHHLVPRSQGGVETVMLHRICHRQIHALFTEQELAKQFSTVAALRAHPSLARFLAWVATRPPSFHERVRGSARRRAVRRGQSDEVLM